MAKHGRTSNTEQSTLDEQDRPEAQSETLNAEVVDDNAAFNAASESTSDAAAEAQIADLEQQLLRVRADFDNFRRRTRQEKEELQQYATRKLLVEILSIVDNFDRALSAMPEDDSTKDMRTGIQMVHRQLLNLLEQQGVSRMDVVGQPFDPNLHEAVMQEPADGRDVGVIVRELQTGYIMHGKVLRPAMVAVTS